MEAKWKQFTKQEIEKMCKESSNMKEFLGKMGYLKGNTHRREIVEQIVNYHNIDISHFTSTNKTKEQLDAISAEEMEQIIYDSKTCKEISKKIGYKWPLSSERLIQILIEKKVSEKTIEYFKNVIIANKFEQLSKEKFQNIIENSNTFKEVIDKIGYQGQNSYLNNMIRRYAAEYNISLEHFHTRDELIGKTFGNFIVLSVDETTLGKGKTKWICECQCEKHTIRSVYTTDLLYKENISCGCKNKTRLIDLTGKKFGKLTVLKRDETSPSDNLKWICQCDCGNQVSVLGGSLRSKHTRSCGCINKSLGEETIEEVLKKLEITYQTQYCFKNESEQYNKLRYDFAIIKDNKVRCFIEYQGSQHYKPFPFFGGQEGLLVRQERDNRKRELALKYQIPLIEISYQDYNKINEEYISNLLNQIAEN